MQLLGICVGMQLLFDGSEEGDSPGLGLIPGMVRRLPETSPAGQVPITHMGGRRSCRIRQQTGLGERWISVSVRYL